MLLNGGLPYAGCNQVQDYEYDQVNTHLLCDRIVDCI